jgi:hypothetical protein
VKRVSNNDRHYDTDVVEDEAEIPTDEKVDEKRSRRCRYFVPLLFFRTFSPCKISGQNTKVINFWSRDPTMGELHLED